jgi:hypothetical protein
VHWETLLCGFEEVGVRLDADSKPLKFRNLTELPQEIR